MGGTAVPPAAMRLCAVTLWAGAGSAIPDPAAFTEDLVRLARPADRVQHARARAGEGGMAVGVYLMATTERAARDLVERLCARTLTEYGLKGWMIGKAA